MESESLSAPCVPDKPDGSWWNGTVVSAARQAIANPDVLAILCTGRLRQSFARYRIPELLRQKGLDFNGVYLNPGGATATFKKSIITKVLSRFPDVTTVHIYEDRHDHLSQFCQTVESLGRICVPHAIRVPPLECEASAIERVARRWVGGFAAMG